MIQFMVIETFFEGQLDTVYKRFKDKGRLLPEGLHYLDSWLSKDQHRCFQLMETENPALFSEWISCWDDVCDFEIIEVGAKP